MTCADEQIGKTLQCSRCAGYFTARPLQLWQVLEQRQRAFETADEPTLQRQENHALREGSPRRKLLLYRQAGAQLDDCGLGAAAQASTGPVERYDLQYEAGYDSRSAKLGCSPELAVVLDDLRSQWNVGAIFRTADCFGWGRLHACGTTPIPPARKLLRVSLGAETSVAWDYHAHVVELIGRLLVDGYVLVALEQTKDAVMLSDFEPPQKTALVVGAEVGGVSAEALERCAKRVSIPLAGRKASLNAAIAFGIAAATISQRWRERWAEQE
jgi:23S rRNA (guanosine2251-2'-O)-methyltransferase